MVIAGLDALMPGHTAVDESVRRTAPPPGGNMARRDTLGFGARCPGRS